ncbi:MAG: tetratricopeptide repeat protein [Spirochaetaceae bacterium]|jgi:tetratricopeptide (TPR) repeat protein|nr:tetratricopeptide repeat protein [Spirochaetaceae bacterium]
MHIIPILVVIIVLVIIGFAASMYLLSEKKSHFKIIKKNRNLASAIKEAAKRLGKNPYDTGALMFVGTQHFQNGEWEEALAVYETIAKMPTDTREIDMSLVNMRAAVCAVKLNMLDTAFKYIAVAHSLGHGSFEIAYQMGNIEFLRNNYEKAVKYLQQAHSLNPEYAPPLRLLGHAYFRLKQFKEAMVYIRKSLEFLPDDRESLFILAGCYFETGQKDKSLRVYSHLRPDPDWGAESCLRSGTINLECHQDKQAIIDFEIGLKHHEIKPSTAVELHYQLGCAYLGAQNINEAMPHLKNVQVMVQNYKDTNELIARYDTLSSNKNLQIYMMAPVAEFVALCRKIVLGYFPKAGVKVTKTQVTGSDWADITAEVDTSKWTDIIMFRFIRSQGATGEATLHDFHSRIKDTKAGKGICMSAGVFSEDAKRFTAARLIDLIENSHFLEILDSVDSARQSNLAP